ncbi:MAG TPA: pilus assembly protein PilM, partial [Actinomycetota bacterium]|nr:pilus assembly protein PilM [Actinomycetota bacterium]
MNLRFLRRERAVGLDVDSGAIKALVLERRRSDVVLVGRGVAPVEAGDDSSQLSQAIHAALADAGADGEPVIAAIGGPDVVIRQVSLPPVPTAKILPALEIQHRELGLLAPGDAVMDAQILRKSKDGVSNEILSASVPRARLDERVRLLQQAAVNVRMLDVEPLALLNAAIHLTGLDAGELLVLLTLGRHTSVLCLFSEQGPVVARYLDVGAETFFERLRLVFEPSVHSTKDFARALPAAEVPRAEAACREIVDRMVEDVRLSLTFYRTEYDRDSLPRYAIGGWIDLPHIIRWVTDRLGLGAPLEVMDPFKAVEVK